MPLSSTATLTPAPSKPDFLHGGGTCEAPSRADFFVILDRTHRDYGWIVGQFAQRIERGIDQRRSTLPASSPARWRLGRSAPVGEHGCCCAPTTTATKPARRRGSSAALNAAIASPRRAGSGGRPAFARGLPAQANRLLNSVVSSCTGASSFAAASRPAGRVGGAGGTWLALARQLPPP
jgi:hypothetical protein